MKFVRYRKNNLNMKIPADPDTNPVFKFRFAESGSGQKLPGSAALSFWHYLDTCNTVYLENLHKVQN